MPVEHEPDAELHFEGFGDADVDLGVEDDEALPGCHVVVGQHFESHNLKDMAVTDP